MMADAPVGRSSAEPTVFSRENARSMTIDSYPTCSTIVPRSNAKPTVVPLAVCQMNDA